MSIYYVSHYRKVCSDHRYASADLSHTSTVGKLSKQETVGGIKRMRPDICLKAHHRSVQCALLRRTHI